MGMFGGAKKKKVPNNRKKKGGDPEQSKNVAAPKIASVSGRLKAYNSTATANDKPKTVAAVSGSTSVADRTKAFNQANNAIRKQDEPKQAPKKSGGLFGGSKGKSKAKAAPAKTAKKKKGGFFGRKGKDKEETPNSTVTANNKPKTVAAVSGSTSVADRTKAFNHANDAIRKQDEPKAPKKSGGLFGGRKGKSKAKAAPVKTAKKKKGGFFGGKGKGKEETPISSAIANKAKPVAAVSGSTSVADRTKAFNQANEAIRKQDEPKQAPKKSGGLFGGSKGKSKAKAPPAKTAKKKKGGFFGRKGKE